MITDKSQLEEILLGYCRNKIIQEEVDIKSIPLLWSLYSRAADYKEHYLNPQAIHKTPQVEIEGMRKKISSLQKIGLRSSKNVQALEEALEKALEDNLAYDRSSNTESYISHLQESLGSYGMLVMTFEQFRAALATKNYKIDTLDHYQGELRDVDIERLQVLYEHLGDFRKKWCDSDKNLAALNLVRNPRAQMTKGNFYINKSVTADVAWTGICDVLVRVEALHDIERDTDCCEEDLDDCRIYPVSIVDYKGSTTNPLMPASIPAKTLNITHLNDNPLFQVYDWSSESGKDATFIFNFPSSDPESIRLSQFEKVDPDTFLVARSANDWSKDNPAIVFQTFLDGVIILAILGYDLNMMHYDELVRRK